MSRSHLLHFLLLLLELQTVEAIARGCPTLREIFSWNVSSIGDEGLSKIAHDCHLLGKLDLFQC
ncbi:hypothetical protein KY289_008458 [Solanum tuberosum]|nr:hypothetical protein KY289_008458 [Solanum tuberosum]